MRRNVSHVARGSVNDVARGYGEGQDVKCRPRWSFPVVIGVAYAYTSLAFISRVVFGITNLVDLDWQLNPR